jgi:hypothetical protein
MTNLCPPPTRCGNEKAGLFNNYWARGSNFSCPVLHQWYCLQNGRRSWVLYILYPGAFWVASLRQGSQTYFNKSSHDLLETLEGGIWDASSHTQSFFLTLTVVALNRRIFVTNIATSCLFVPWAYTPLQATGRCSHRHSLNATSVCGLAFLAPWAASMTSHYEEQAHLEQYFAS